MNARRHILLYTDDAEQGGVAQYNHAVLLALAQRGDRITCVQTESQSPLIQQQTAAGIQHVWLPYDPEQEFPRSLTRGEDAVEVFEKTQPDFVLFSNCSPVSHVAAKEVAVQAGLPFVIVESFASDYLRERFTEYVPTLRRHYTAAREVVAVSEATLCLLRSGFGLPNDKGRVITYGRPDLYFKPSSLVTRERLRSAHGIPGDAVVSLTIARLDPAKGYEFLVEALRRLRDRPEWEKLHFVWIGTGRNEQTLAKIIDDEGFAGKVHLLGHCWDTGDWLDAADFFVLTSKAEGMPLAIMEAMAKRLPVAATAVSGIPEQLGPLGYLLPDPSRDPDRLVKALVEIIVEWSGNHEQRRFLGNACHVRARRLFREERMLGETLGVIERAFLPAGDYVAPGLSIVRPDTAFPELTQGDPRTCPWPHLRREIPHNWYVDKRWPRIGFLNRDEAVLLHNLALRFERRAALEIGCWLGWSTCHLALAGLELDVIDPILAESAIRESVKSSLAAAGVMERVRLHPTGSPVALQKLAAQGRRWSFFFIDGDHEGEAPLRDAELCARYAEEDAQIVFHDLAAPAVAKAWGMLGRNGWRMRLYHTMQVMGVAWRGKIEPVRHEPDPTIDWQLPVHITKVS